MKGSMTVEAAYVFPLCFMILVIVCFLGIYQYNQSVLKMTGYECILLTMEDREAADSAFEELLLRRAKQAGRDRTIGVEQLETELKMTETQILLNYTGIQSVLSIPIETEIVYKRIYPEITLRITKGLVGE